MSVAERLASIRESIILEEVSQGEIIELQGMIDDIDPSDMLLMEWAGVPEAEAIERQALRTYYVNIEEVTYDHEGVEVSRQMRPIFETRMQTRMEDFSAELRSRAEDMHDSDDWGVID